MSAKKESSELLLTHVRQLHTSTPAPSKVIRRYRPLNLEAKVGLVLGAIVFVLPLAIDIPHLDESDERMLTIFLLAIVLWITEPIALSAATMLAVRLRVITVSGRALVDPTLGDAALVGQVTSYKSYLATLANPMMTLFMGGFVIVDGATKYGLDKDPAAVILRPFPRNTRLTTLGLMLITMVLSMFMSNTVTTATMFTVVISILATLPKGKARAGMALSIPLATNVGGIGTPVGTPPNAITIGTLAEESIAISFIQWMVLATPFMLVILSASWVSLSLMFIPRNAEINTEMNTSWSHSFAAVLFYIVANTTVLLWMTEFIHGVSSTVVDLLPVMMLLSPRAMTGEDIKKLGWSVLWLVAGGIALGEGMGATGLDTWIVGSIPWDSFSPMLIVAVISLTGFAIANVISHSASANPLIPLAVTLVVSLESMDTMTVAVAVAMARSLGMFLPISIPPNAIVYSAGEVRVKGIATLGIMVGDVSTIVLVLVMPPL